VTAPIPSARVRRYLAVRRVLELIVVAVLTPLVLVAVALVASAVWIEDRERVVFVQWRAGRSGTPFRLLKFRSMRGGRVTRVGGVLRRLHLDEIPQLWNVVRGEMSLIGPRPVPVDEYRDYVHGIDNYDWRHLIRPGLLGKAQVVLGYTQGLVGERRKWLLDIDYVRHLGWRLDGRIVLASLRLPGSGLRDPRPDHEELRVDAQVAEDPAAAG
jgi:lipopolysaccharide/colanic/teichoic acid biosynthesis glycosyltransferase